MNVRYCTICHRRLGYTETACTLTDRCRTAYQQDQLNAARILLGGQPTKGTTT